METDAPYIRKIILSALAMHCKWCEVLAENDTAEFCRIKDGKMTMVPEDAITIKTMYQMPGIRRFSKLTLPWSDIECSMQMLMDTDTSIRIRSQVNALVSDDIALAFSDATRGCLNSDILMDISSKLKARKAKQP